MNEGKPAKAKWWNRPRPQGPSAEPEGPARAPDDLSGPTTPDGAAGDAGARGHGADVEGDFELARPAVGDGRGGTSAEGDFELARPAVGAAGDGAAKAGDFELRPAVSGSGGDGASAETDFVLARPAARVDGDGDGDGDAASGEGDFELARPSGAPASVPEADVTVTAVGAADDAERPKPLHDPDPYSTPPYGEPGPWAPAPPVQHPATTPAHGTSVATPPVAHGVPMPEPVAPAPTTGTQDAAHPAPAPPVPPPPSVAEPTPTPSPALSSTVTAAPPASPPRQRLRRPAQPPRPPPPRRLRRRTPHPPPTHGRTTTPGPAPPHDPPPHRPLQHNGVAGVTGEPSRSRGRKALLVGALLLALVSGGVGGAVGTYLERNGGVGDVELPQAGSESAGRAPDSVAGIAARALPSVVTLHVSGNEEQGTGTGFVLDDRGHILTNNHVVEPAGDDGEISVTFHSGDTAKATVVGRDGGYDLAVVKVTGVRGLAPLPLGNSDNVHVGDPVVAIGAPFDLAGTVTSGIVSAKERPITAGGESGDGSDVSYVDALQTDAPINPGNSGGPLLDAQGRVVGINSAIRSADSGSDLDGGQAGSIGLGFAIPVNQAKRVAEELINTGRATHPVIGVTLDMDYTGDGARVGAKGSDGGPAVTGGGPGAKAGIKSGDVITEVNGQRVHSGEELIVRTRAHRPGDRLELTLERGGKEISVSLTLGSSSGD
ncbi:trypsin-like peptidase domain-containing protein [Streptomyces sp. NBC_00443]|uniref:trypsin-like peptidase domain-containing protein n=1 Tax=Streptomyces sp. NBC_00443 TaxID=2975743 RepID=UPI002E2094AE